LRGQLIKVTIHGAQGRVRTLPLCESSRDDVIQSIAQFLSPRNPFQARGPHASHEAREAPRVLRVSTAEHLLLRQRVSRKRYTSMPASLKAAPPQVLIVSYETFRLHAEKFRGEGACDLLICDEAHRLKNDQTLTNKARACAETPTVWTVYVPVGAPVRCAARVPHAGGCLGLPT
jgi:hypothetical protein